MKKSVKTTIILCLLITLLSTAMIFVSCKPQEQPQQKLTITTTLTDRVVDVEKIIDIPQAEVIDSNGNKVDQPVKVKVYRPDGGIVWAKTGEFRVPDTGVWSVVYSSEKADDLTVKLTCEDLSAPTFNVKGLKRFASVNQTIKLDVFNPYDYSGLKADETKLDVYRKDGESWTLCEYSSENMTFVPTAEGIYKVAYSLKDNVGNASTSNFEILVVSESYKIADLTSGYIAEFNDKVYSFLAESMVVDGIDELNDPETEILEGVVGALNSNAMKVKLYKGDNGATLRLLLPSVNAGSLENAGQSLTLRFKGVEGLEKWYVNGDANTENLATISKPDANGWCIMNIPLSTLDDSAYNLESIELVFGEEMDETKDLFFDFVRMSNILSTPSEFDYSYQNQKLTWSAVANASSYIIETNGQTYTSTGTEIEIPVGQSFKIKTVGDLSNYLDSDWSNEVNALKTPKGYIVDFNNEYLTTIVGSANDTNTWWASGVVKPEYVASGVAGAINGDAVKTTMSIKADEGTGKNPRAAINLYLPSVIDGSLSGDTIRLRMKIAHDTASLSEMWWNGTPSSAANPVRNMVGDADANGWRIITIPISITKGLYGLEKLTLGFLNFGETDTEITVYLDCIKAMEILDTPTGIVYDYNTEVLSWNAVDNATSYVVVYDGVEHSTNTTSISVPENKIVTVKALAAGYDDSYYSREFATMVIPEGYAMNYSSVMSETFIANGGDDRLIDATWKCPTFDTEYVSSGVAGAEGGDAVKVTMGVKQATGSASAYYLASLSLTFPTIQQGNLDGGMSLLFRYKANVDLPIQVFMVNDDGQLRYSPIISDDNGWKIMKLPLSLFGNDIYGLKRLHFGFYPLTTNNNIEMYLDYVKAERINIVVPNGYIADYNTADYDKLVTNGGTAGGDWWDATSLSTQYLSSGVTGAENGNALKLTMGIKGDNRVSFTLTFIEPATGTLNGDTIVLRFKAMDGSNPVAVFYQDINSSAVDYNFTVSSADANGWRELSIPASKVTGGVYGLKSIGLALYPYSAGGTCEVFLDYVKVVQG